MNRREVLKLIGAASAACSLPLAAAAEEAKPEGTMETYVYKTLPQCRIKLDVYRGLATDTPRPVVITIHGGALITGARYPIQMDLFAPLLDQGFAVVSIDYRLAPETKLPEIIKDIQEAYGWVRENGPDAFGADPARIGVQGGSAGGYLTLLTGYCVDPRPKALVSYYGYGDIIGPWYSKPDPFYSSQPAVSKEAALTAVGEGTPCGYPQGNRRHEFYLYCRQNGLWPREVVGYDPVAMPQSFKPFCPVQNVTADYPPTFLAHGDEDTDVPHELSVQMNEALRNAGVEREFITLQGAGHGFSHADKKDYQNVLDRTVAFLVKHLK